MTAGGAEELVEDAWRSCGRRVGMGWRRRRGSNDGGRMVAVSWRWDGDARTEVAGDFGWGGPWGGSGACPSFSQLNEF